MKKTSSKTMRGFSPVIIVVAIVAVLGVGGAIYYVTSKDKESSGSNSSQVVVNEEAQSECLKYYDDKDLCKFTASWEFEGAMKTTMVATDNTTTTYETDGNGNSRMTSTKDGAETMAIVTLGKTTYTKNAETGNWMKFTAPESEESKPESEEFADDISEELNFAEEFSDNTEVKKEAKEACGDLTCFKYTFTQKDTPGETTTIWFDDKDYKMRKMELKNAESTTVMTFDYNVSPITEPSPVVEVPSFDTMTPEQMQQYLETLQ